MRPRRGRVAALTAALLCVTAIAAAPAAPAPAPEPAPTLRSAFVARGTSDAFLVFRLTGDLPRRADSSVQATARVGGRPAGAVTALDLVSFRHYCFRARLRHPWPRDRARGRHHAALARAASPATHGADRRTSPAGRRDRRAPGLPAARSDEALVRDAGTAPASRHRATYGRSILTISPVSPRNGPPRAARLVSVELFDTYRSPSAPSAIPAG